MQNDGFRMELSRKVFNDYYKDDVCPTWISKSEQLPKDLDGLLTKEEQKDITHLMKQFKLMPGGRIIHFTGKKRKFYKNCFLMGVREDTKESWAETLHNAFLYLSCQGGIGSHYGKIRKEGELVKGTGGKSGGPISLMKIIDSIGQQTVRGFNGRGAIFATLPHNHGDILKFLHAKDWSEIVIDGISIRDAVAKNFDFPAPLKFTNISVAYDQEWYQNYLKTGDCGSVFEENCRQACKTGEPGFHFQIIVNRNNGCIEIYTNACTESRSDTIGDSCMIASSNISAAQDIEDFKFTVDRTSRLLVACNERCELPTEESKRAYQENHRIGVGILGGHAWLLKRGYKYEMNDELRKWLRVYQETSEKAANEISDRLGISRPRGYQAIAPTGTISIIAAEPSAFEPIVALGYKRRTIGSGKREYQYVIDPIVKNLIEVDGVNPKDIETAYDLAKDPERRIAFQAELQEYVDQGIASTVNLPAWGSEFNNEKTVPKFRNILLKYVGKLQGITFYPDGARGGQPIVPVSYEEAKKFEGQTFEETFDSCSLQGGGCGT